MGGLKTEWLRLMNMTKIIGDEFPEYITYQQQKIYNILEDVHSVASMTELQDAIDSIGNEAGTIFITAGTHVVDTPIDIDGGGSLVIYGHGDNTILQPADGIPVFNITDCQSLIIKTLQIDASNYTGATSSIIIDEATDNVVSTEDVTIVGNNFGTGIELVSDNCIIENCNISQMNDGIYLNNSNRNIIAQNTVSSNARYGISLDTVLYSNIGNNISNSNLTGIYILNSTNNSISNNISNQNTEHGIYIHSSSYNTLSGNTCENNDSNTANDQAGMYITNNSSFNTISGNSLNNNNNIGAGDGFGLVIATNTCIENVVASNNANGNDIDWKDAGLRTVIKYYVQSGDELQDAIDSIGTGAGTIVITTGVLTLTATILVNGGGTYIIEGEGEGTVIDCGADRSVFNITNAETGTTLKNLRIDATDLTTNAREVITVNEISDNKIIVNNITVIGNGTRGYGLAIYSNNCIVSNCNISLTYLGIYGNSAENCFFENNILDSCQFFGVSLENCTDSMINDNNIYGGSTYGIWLDGCNLISINSNSLDGVLFGAAIWRSTYITFEGNSCYGTGVDASDGVQFSGCDYCVIIGNSLNNHHNCLGVKESNFMTVAGNNCNDNNTGILVRDSDNVVVSGNNCNGNVWIGIYISKATSQCDYITIVGNNCENNGRAGIRAWFMRHGTILGNVCNNNVSIENTDGGGIYVCASCEYISIVGNTCENNTNPFPSTHYGIRIEDATINDILISSNILNGNDIDLGDAGTDTIIYADDTVYGIGWLGDLGTPTKNVIYNKIESLFTPPIGYIAMYSGVWVDNTTIIGWYKCDGNNGTVNLVDKFVRGGATSGASGGSDDAVVVEHNHGASQTMHAHGSIGYTTGAGSQWQIVKDKLSGSTTIYTDNKQPDITVNNEGVSGVGANKPAYYTLIFIQRIS